MEHISRVVISTAGLSGPITVEVLGCLTLESFAAASAVFDQWSGMPSSPDLIVDLRATEHIEPVGLGALEMYFARYRAPKGLPEITLVTPPFPRPCVLDGLASIDPRDPHADSDSREESRSDTTYERRPFLRWRPPAGAPPDRGKSLHPA